MIFSIFLATVFLFMAIYSFAFIRPRSIRLLLCVAYLAGIYFVWKPAASTIIASAFGIGRGLDFFLILLSVTIVNALVLVARHINAQHRALTKLARYCALQDAQPSVNRRSVVNVHVKP